MSRPRAASKVPYDTTRLQSVGGGKNALTASASGLIWCSSTIVRPNTCHTHSPTHHIQAGLCTHRLTSSLYIPSQPFYPCTEMVMGSPYELLRRKPLHEEGATLPSPPYAAPWSTVRTYRGQAAPSSSGHTISPHAGRRSLCVSAPVILWLTTKCHAKLLHCCCAPTIQAPLALTYTCMAVGTPLTR
jgi:hypothetical protein